MPSTYTCPAPHCGVSLKTPLRLPAGKSVVCPRCGLRFVAEPSGAPPDTRPQEAAERDRLAPAFSVPAFEPGETLPGLSSWVLERQLGSGGFGEVWRVRHEWKDERRAVKFFTHPEVRHRLVAHEKKVLVRVMRHAGEHPNIVPLLEYNLGGEVPWLMYEYVPGGTLADAVREWQTQPLAKRVRKAVRALFAIAGAVAHCHRLTTPIVHRDLKPQNVLRDGLGILRVTDFGIGGAAVAHLIDGQTRGLETNSGRVPTLLRAAGSFGYAGPQQRNGNPPDPRDDVYALGVLAFQLLRGDLTVWPGPDMTDDLRALGLPRGLVALFVQSVAQNPGRRPADARDWQNALAALTTRPGEGDTHTGSLTVVNPPPPRTPSG
ncbi:MAG: serine/threonine-protein kinase [Gemmata sp.]